MLWSSGQVIVADKVMKSISAAFGCHLDHGTDGIAPAVWIDLLSKPMDLPPGLAEAEFTKSSRGLWICTQSL